MHVSESIVVKQKKLYKELQKYSSRLELERKTLVYSFLFGYNEYDANAFLETQIYLFDILRDFDRTNFQLFDICLNHWKEVENIKETISSLSEKLEEANSKSASFEKNSFDYLKIENDRDILEKKIKILQQNLEDIINFLTNIQNLSSEETKQKIRDVWHDLDITYLPRQSIHTLVAKIDESIGIKPLCEKAKGASSIAEPLSNLIILCIAMIYLVPYLF